LAIVRANSYTGISNAIDLVILDSTTGNLRTVGANLPDVEGKHYVSDFTWTPDSLHLLAFTNIPSHDGYYDLYLIDLISDQSTNLFPEFKSFGGGGNNFVWSPDGSKLLARCPLSSALRVTTRYCLIDIQTVK
jgi:Tol biopolymer transport system component